jgi:hypothetical protein
VIAARKTQSRRCGPQIAGLLLNETADRQPPSENAILIFRFGGSRRLR